MKNEIHGIEGRRPKHILAAFKTCNTKKKGDPDSEFLFKEQDGKLFVTSINEMSEQTLWLQTEKLEAEPGEMFSANGQSIVDYVRLFPDTKIGCMFDAENHAFFMASETRTSRFALPTPEEIDFLPMNVVFKNKNVAVDASALSEALRCTAFAASSNPSATPLTAVKLTITEDAITAEAMDNFRISRYSIQTSSGVSEPVELLIPRETAETLHGLLKGVNMVTIKPGVSHVRCEWDETQFTARLESLSSKPFPNIQQVLNSDQEAIAKVSKADFQRALNTVGLVAKDSYILLKVATDENGVSAVSLTADESDKGAAMEAVIVQDGSGEAETFVGWKYISKAVDSANDAWIEISFRSLRNGTIGAVVCDSGYEHMVLPVIPNNFSDSDEEDENGSGEEEE